MIRKLLPFLFSLVLLALPALAQVKPGKPIAPAVRNFAPRYSPDGKWIAYLRGGESDAELWVMDTERKMTRKLLDANRTHNAPIIPAPDQPAGPVGIPGMPGMPADYIARDPWRSCGFEWLPDSSSLICAFISTPEILPITLRIHKCVFHVNLNGEILLEIRHYDRSLTPGFAIAPDGKEAAFFFDTKYYRVPLHKKMDDLKEIKPAEFPELNGANPSWGIDGRIYFSARSKEKDNDYNPDIYAIEKDGKITQITKTPTRGETFPALSPDGKKLAYLSKPWVRHGNVLYEWPLSLNSRNTLIVRDMATGKENEVVKKAVRFRWLPDGRLLAATSETNPDKQMAYAYATYELTECFVIIQPGAKKFDLRAITRTASLSMVSNSKDDPTTVDLSGNKAFGFINEESFFLPDISPDGKRLVYEKDGTLYLMDMPAKPAEVK